MDKLTVMLSIISMLILYQLLLIRYLPLTLIRLHIEQKVITSIFRKEATAVELSKVILSEKSPGYDGI